MTYHYDLALAVHQTTRLRPMYVSGALGAAAVVVPGTLSLNLNLLDATLIVHLVMFTQLIGVAFVCDDPVRSSIAATSTSVSGVASVRLFWVLTLLTCFWLPVLWIAPSLIEASGTFSRAGLLPEPYVVALIVLSAAHWGAGRNSEHLGSPSALGVLLGFVTIALFLPDGLRLLANPAEADFVATRWRWLGVTVCAVGAWLLANGSGERPGFLGRWGKRQGLARQPG